MKVNADGSADLYFGLDRAPVGFENNWLPTMGKKPYLWFRLYAPGEAFLKWQPRAAWTLNC